MLRVYDILDNAEVQCSVRYCTYDYDSDQRVELSEKKARGMEVRYIYVEDGELWIEVESEVEDYA